MKKSLTSFIDFYKKAGIGLYVSILGSLIMGTFHLIFVIIKFDWILVNYCIFSYLMMLFKVWQWAIDKYHLKPNSYIAGTISMILVLAPMMAAFILTILYKDAPHYLFDWFIYAYALYGTLKMVFAIRGIVKKDKTDKQFVLSFLSLVGALYTLQMMEFNLIMTFDEGTDNAMYLMQLFTQGAIFLFAIFVIVLFIYKFIKLNQSSPNEEQNQQ